MRYSVWVNNTPRDRRGHTYPQGLARNPGGRPFVFETEEEANEWIRANGYTNTTDATVGRSAYVCEPPRQRRRYRGTLELNLNSEGTVDIWVVDANGNKDWLADPSTWTEAVYALGLMQDLDDYRVKVTREKEAGR